MGSKVTILPLGVMDFMPEVVYQVGDRERFGPVSQFSGLFSAGRATTQREDTMVLNVRLTRNEIEQAIRDYIIDAIPSTRDMDFDILSLPYSLEVVVMERVEEAE